MRRAATAALLPRRTWATAYRAPRSGWGGGPGRAGAHDEPAPSGVRWRSSGLATCASMSTAWQEPPRRLHVTYGFSPRAARLAAHPAAPWRQMIGAATAWRNGSFPHATGETPGREKPGAVGWPLAAHAEALGWSRDHRVPRRLGHGRRWSPWLRRQRIPEIPPPAACWPSIVATPMA